MEDLPLQSLHGISARRLNESAHSKREMDSSANKRIRHDDEVNHENDLLAARPLVRVTVNDDYEPLVAKVSQCSEESSVADCIPRTVNVPIRIPPNQMSSDDFPDDESGPRPMYLDQAPSVVSSFSESVSDDENYSMYMSYSPSENAAQGRNVRIDDNDSVIMRTSDKGESTCSWQESMCDATTDVLSVGATMVASIITFMNVDCATGYPVEEDKIMRHESIPYAPSEVSI